jgi:hypothetical protein
MVIHGRVPVGGTAHFPVNEGPRAPDAFIIGERTTVSLVRLLRDTGRRDEARAMLTEIYNWFTEGFDTADLRDAKALLDASSN